MDHHPWLEPDWIKGLDDDNDDDTNEHHDDENGDVVSDNDAECYNSDGHCGVSGGR